MSNPAQQEIDEAQDALAVYLDALPLPGDEPAADNDNSNT